MTSPFPAKAQKPMYSILIYDEIRAMDPPGRFLKQDPNTKLWSDIGKKKALDKTRQALREGAPEMLKEMGGGDNDEDNEEDKEDEETQKQNPVDNTQVKKRRDDNPLAESFMSIGSFSVEGLNESLPELIPSVIHSRAQNRSDARSGNIQLQNNQGIDPNQTTLVSAQMQLIQHQMNQWQQVINMQNALQSSGNLDPNTQLQLLNLQLQLQSQIRQLQQSQQQNLAQQQQMQFQGNNTGRQQQTIPNFVGPQGNHTQGVNFMSNQNFSQSGIVPPRQVNDPNIAALLSAIHHNAVNQNNVVQNLNQESLQSSTPRGSLQQHQNQLTMHQTNQQINSNQTNQINNSSQWGGPNTVNVGDSSIAYDNLQSNNGIYNQNSQFGDFILPLNDQSDQDQIIGMTMPLQDNERKPGASSYARSQRIGLKNSFTRRPNSHRQLTTNAANSLMSLESLNLDDIEELDGTQDEV